MKKVNLFRALKKCGVEEIWECGKCEMFIPDFFLRHWEGPSRCPMCGGKFDRSKMSKL